MFFPLQQSAFLHALGSAIGNSLWQLAALWLVFSAISGIAKMNPANRYRMAVFFSSIGFLWFTGSFASSYVSNISSPTEAWIIYQSVDNPIVATGFSNNISFIYRSLLASLASLSPYISCAYLLVWLLLATRLINGFRQVKQFGTQGLGKVDIDLKLFVQQHATLLQIQKKVRIFTSAYVQSPLTIGFFKPLILLPVASLSHLSTEQVEAILLHELAHIKRHDYLVNIFVQIAEATLFFNPFMRLLLKQVKQERENCCDDYVLQFQYSAADYAKALLGIAQNRTATLLAMSAKNNQFQLLNRIKRMVAPQPQTFNYRQQLYMLCLITILGLGITMIVPSSIAQTKKEIVVSPKTSAQPKVETPIVVNADKTIEEPVQPQKPSFDFIKSIQHLANSITAKKMDLDEIEKEGEEIDNHGQEIEQQTKQITEKALKDAQPEIDKALAFSKNFTEKMSLANVKFPEDGNINEVMAIVSQKINEALKEVPAHINVSHPAAKPEAPVAPVPNVKIKILRQLQPLLERKMLITKEQLDEQQANQKKSMDSLQAAMVELGNSEKQRAINKLQAKLAAIKSKEEWNNIAFNENEDLNNCTNRITTAYTNQMGKMIKKMVNGMVTSVDIKDLNDIKVQLEGEIDKIGDKINIEIRDKRQEKAHRKNATINIITDDNENAQGS